MDKQELAQLLMVTFVGELDERVQALNRDLLSLESRPAANERAELLKTLFRSAHSLKGAARAVNVELIETACHQMEEVLTAVRDGRISFEPAHFALLFSVVDAVQEAGRRLRDKKDLKGAPLEGLVAPLSQAFALGPGCAAPKASPAPAAAPTTAPPMPLVAAPVPAAPTSMAAVAELVPSAPSPLVAKAPGPVSSPPPIRQAASPFGASATIRVAAEKLDTLLAHSGELLVARRRVASRAADLDRLREDLAVWTAQWRGIAGLLGHWLKSAEGPSKDGRRESRLPPRLAAVLGRTAERLHRLEAGLERLSRDYVADGRALKQAGTALDREVHRARMLQFGEACQGLARAVRDVAQATGKQAAVVLEGQDVEMDRSILEGLRDPLLHMVRNAVDHGLEAPAARREAGKPLQGRVTVSAALRGSQVEVVVADDGRGLDLEAIRRQAEKRGLAVPQDEGDVKRLLFAPGFSTAAIVTDLSGRGVGLDVVHSQLEALHGSVDVESEPGRGTRFILTVPLTLTTISALLFKVAGETLALASAHVRSLVRFRSDELRRVGGRDVLLLGEAPLAVVPLAHLLGLPAHEPADAAAASVAVIVSTGGKQAAFVVDQALEEQVIVVQGLGARIRRLRLVSGATLLPSGRIALLLNAANLLAAAAGRPSGAVVSPDRAQAAKKAKPRLLVAEDSLTTRTLMKSILEGHGYEVAVAVDGQEAWDRLQELDVQLVVSDVEMPRMDGFVLTEAIRKSKRLNGLPVILVTAREADADKARGIEVGADAYLVKSAFDQTKLLATISQLL